MKTMSVMRGAPRAPLPMSAAEGLAFEEAYVREAALAAALTTMQVCGGQGRGVAGSAVPLSVRISRRAYL